MSLTQRIIARAGLQPMALEEDPAAQPLRLARLIPKDRGMGSSFGTRSTVARATPEEEVPASPQRAPAEEDMRPNRISTEGGDSGEGEAAPIRRMPGEEEQPSEASPLRRSEEDAEEVTSRRQKESEDGPAAPRRQVAREEAEEVEAQPRREPQEEEAAAPMREGLPEEDGPAAPLRRSEELPESEPLEGLRHDQGGKELRSMRREAIATPPNAPSAAVADTPPTAAHGHETTFASTYFEPGPRVDTPVSPQPLSTAAPQRPRVHIDQIDVVVAAPAAPPAASSQLTGAKAALASRYLRKR